MRSEIEQYFYFFLHFIHIFSSVPMKQEQNNNVRQTIGQALKELSEEYGMSLEEVLLRDSSDSESEAADERNENTPLLEKQGSSVRFGKQHTLESDEEFENLTRTHSTLRMRRASTTLSQHDRALRRARLSVYAPGQARIHFQESDTPILDFVQHHFIAIYISFHVLIGLCFFRFWEGESFVNSLYFVINICTTVGNGSFRGMHAPGTSMFLMMYSMASVAFLASAISKEFEVAFSDHHKKLTFIHHDQSDHDVVWEVEEEMTLWEQVKSSDVGHFIVWLFWLCSGGLAIGSNEGWPLSSSIYFAIMSATTIGFGADEPNTDTAKWLAIIYLPVLIFLTTSLLSKAYVRIKAYIHVDIQEFQSHLTHIFDPSHFAESLHNMDIDDHHGVNVTEFTLQILINEYHVEPEKITIIHDYFNTLNRTHTGVLTEKDIIAVDSSPHVGAGAGSAFEEEEI